MSDQQIGRLLGAGRIAEVFEYGDAVLKLYISPDVASTVFSEAAVLARVREHGLPVPAVHLAGQFDERWGLVMDRAPGEALAKLAQADPELVPEALEEMVRLHLGMHAVAERRLPPLKLRLAGKLAAAPRLDAALRKRLIADLAALPDGDRICHGDFHPFNIMGSPGASMVVDWPDASSGPPAADVCRSYLLMLQVVPELAGAYLERYLALSGLSHADILAWLPVVAAARLTEGVVEEEENLLRLAATPV